MVENTATTKGINIDTNMIIGIGIGVLLAWLIFGKSQQSQQQSQQQYQQQESSQIAMQRQLSYGSILNDAILNDTILNAGYKNAEVWEVERSPDGFIARVRADRNAKVQKAD